MQVLRSEDDWAWCSADPADPARAEHLDMRLIGAQPVGTWVLAFMGAAREVLSAEQAAQTQAAHRALVAVMQGVGDTESFFADLIGREPSLPEHLRPVTPSAPALGSLHELPAETLP
jgi:hydrogenase assembly chaperone HypC/HupF